MATVSENRPDDKVLETKLFYRRPYHWPAVIEFLQARAIPGIESAEHDMYRRWVCFDSIYGIIEVRPGRDGPFLLLRTPSELSEYLDGIIERVRRLFDLEVDPSAIAGHFQKDRDLSAMATAYPGLRVPGAWDGFEIAVRAVVGQQISVKAATTMMGRLQVRSQ